MTEISRKRTETGTKTKDSDGNVTEATISVMPGVSALRDMKINTEEVEIRGYHLFFRCEEVSVICKMSDDILFDFVEFENDFDAAKEYFYKQRKNISVKIHEVKRFREEQICLRSIFNGTIF